MEPDAGQGPETLVQHLAVQRVPEQVARFGRRAVRRQGEILEPALAALELCARLGQRHRVDVEDARHRRQPEPHAADACGLDNERCSGVS